MHGEILLGANVLAFRVSQRLFSVIKKKYEHDKSLGFYVNMYNLTLYTMRLMFLVSWEFMCCFTWFCWRNIMCNWDSCEKFSLCEWFQFMCKCVVMQCKFVQVLALRVSKRPFQLSKKKCEHDRFLGFFVNMSWAACLQCL